MSPTFRIKRDKDLALVFEGRLLAEVSSRDHDDQNRWQEIRIYVTEQKYVVEQIAETNIPGEVSRHFVHVCYSPAQVLEKLKTPADAKTWNPEVRKRGWFFTDLALEVLDALEEADPAFTEVASVTIEDRPRKGH